MYRKFLFLTSFVLVLTLAYTSYGTDTTKPKPNPSSFALAPSSSGLTSITMKATHSVDEIVPPDDANSPPLEYYFACLAPNAAKSSLWQTSEEYTATGLTRGNIYWFKVRVRDTSGNISSYSAPIPEIAGTIRLDFDNAGSPAAETEAGYTKVRLEDTGMETNSVIIDLSGNLNSKRMAQPYYEPPDSNHEEIYRDMIFGFTNTSPITITLWGLGADRDCNITMFAYDAGSTPNRIADWNCNGTYLFTTDFNGGTSKNWPFSSAHPGDYVWTEANKADYLGRIVLKSWKDPNSPETQPFAFTNALVVSPKGSFVKTKYAYRPQPFDGVEDTPIDTVLKWLKGDGVDNHDLYFGDDEDAVTDADRTTHPGLLIYEEGLAANYGQDVNGNNVYDPYNSNGFLELDKTYYWRVDELDSPTFYEGEVTSFKTLPYFVVDNFNSYEEAEGTLTDVWKDTWENSTCAVIHVMMGVTDPNLVRPVGSTLSRSMQYEYRNSQAYPNPYYSEVYADIATLGDDPDWLGFGAKSLSIWFRGQTSNPTTITEKMYVTVTDGDNESGTVEYPASDANATREPWWHEWNIALQEFVDDNPSLDLTNVSRLTIGFGDGIAPGYDGLVYIEDIRLYVTRCALARRSGDFARLDFSPGGSPSGDCVIDYNEIEVMAGAWLREDAVIATHNPGDTNLVVYYPLNEGIENGDGNKVYSMVPGDVCNPKWTGTLYNWRTTPAGNVGASWAEPGGPRNDDPTSGDHCVFIDGFQQGTRVQCGTYGDTALGIGRGTPPPPGQEGYWYPGDINAITLSVWVKWLGPRASSSYLMTKSGGILGKRGGWSDNAVVWMFETSIAQDGAFAFRHYGPDPNDVYTPANLLFPYIGQWIHLAATFPNPSGNPADQNDFARLFLNGDQVSAGPWRFSYGDDPNIFLTIGCTQDINAWVDCPESFNGYIDEVRIYNHALEPNEIGYLADTSPEDGYLYVPVQSAAELYTETSNVGINHYTVTVTDTATDGDEAVIDGTSDGYTDGNTAYGWYRYPESGWWNVWFNNQPHDKNRYKVAVLQLTLEQTDDDPNATIITGGSTNAWNDANAHSNERPPLPSDAPTLELENLYINRTEPNNVVFSGPVEGSVVVNIPIFIWSCNPGWAFVDIQGRNFAITSGYIRHECRLVGSVNFKDFAILVNQWLKEEMFPLP